MDEMKPCPFCNGTKLKIEEKSKLVGWNGLGERVEQHTYSVRCNVCHARGGAIGGKVLPYAKRMPIPPWATTDEELEKKAKDGWNRRAGNG